MFLFWSPPYTRTHLRDTQTQHPKRITKRYKTSTIECVLLLDTHRHSRHIGESFAGRRVPLHDNACRGRDLGVSTWDEAAAPGSVERGTVAAGSGGIASPVTLATPRRGALRPRASPEGATPGATSSGRGWCATGLAGWAL